MRANTNSVMKEGSILISFSEPKQMCTLSPPNGILILKRSKPSVTLHVPKSEIKIRRVNHFEGADRSFSVSKSNIKRSKTCRSLGNNCRSSVGEKVSKGMHGIYSQGK